jgi:hypothetical protein
VSSNPSGVLVHDGGKRASPDTSECSRWRLEKDPPMSAPSTPWVELTTLEHAQLDAGEIVTYTDLLVQHLERVHSGDALTPGGISWLRVHAVPVRRLVTQVVKKLLGLSSWRPFATEPGPIVTPVDGAPVEIRDPAVLGYHAYTVAWSGIAFLLADSPETHGLGGVDEQATKYGATDMMPDLGAASADVMAVSWSSRHAKTLLPVLKNLTERGFSSLVVDLATEPSQRFSDSSSSEITVRRMPEVFADMGGLMALPADEKRAGRVLQVGACRIHLSRLAWLAARAVERSTDCTQPSWAAACRLERLLDGVFAAAKPKVLLCSNDTSPVGVLAVGAADRANVDTVYVQHGAWVSGQVTGRAEHCRHIAVMGTRDVAVARQWARRGDAEVHVVGQPRFDALADTDRARQRQYLRDLLSAHGRVPEHVLVWACQPVSASRLRRQFDMLVNGVRHATSGWGLVIAPHPVQSEAALTSLLASGAGVPAAVTPSDLGARGCLGGAHAVASASSTCGIEALLLNVPVLELALPGSRTLELAEQHAARRCGNGNEVAAALDEVVAGDAPVEIPDVVKDAVCRSTGSAADAVAEIVAACMTNDAVGQQALPASTTAFAPGEGELR